MKLVKKNALRRGVSMLEYGLLAAGIGIVALGSVELLGTNVKANNCSLVTTMTKTAGTYGSANIGPCAPKSVYFSYGIQNTAMDNGQRVGTYSLSSHDFSGGILGLLNPDTVSFGFTLYNNGSIPAKINAPQVVGLGEPVMWGGNCTDGYTLAPGESCNANFQFESSVLSALEPGTNVTYTATMEGIPSDTVTLKILP